MKKETKSEAQMRALGEFMTMCSSLPSYKMYLKYCQEKDRSLFTESTFAKYYFLKKGVDTKTPAGKSIVKYFKDNLKEGNIDMSTVSAKDDGIYARKYGSTSLECIYSYAHINGKPSLNKTVRDVKTGEKIVIDFSIDFNAPVAKKMHLMVDKYGAHIRWCDAYIADTFHSKKLYKVS